MKHFSSSEKQVGKKHRKLLGKWNRKLQNWCRERKDFYFSFWNLLQILNLQVNRNQKEGFVCHRIGNRFPGNFTLLSGFGGEASFDCRNESSASALASCGLWMKTPSERKSPNQMRKFLLIGINWQWHHILKQQTEHWSILWYELAPSALISAKWTCLAEEWCHFWFGKNHFTLRFWWSNICWHLTSASLEAWPSTSASAGVLMQTRGLDPSSPLR